MNLIITPYWKAKKRLLQMMEAIDENSRLPYFHIIVGDNEQPPSLPKHKDSNHNRVALINKYDEDPAHHRNNAGEALQLAYETGIRNINFEYLFLVENDVIVRPGWDKKMIDDIKDMPDNWGTLDVWSVDTRGKVTYPTPANPSLEQIGRFYRIAYADFQSTLFNPKVLELDWKFNDFPSHFDIMISRKITDLSGRIHLRDPNIKALHYPFSSRKYLP